MSLNLSNRQFGWLVGGGISAVTVFLMGLLIVTVLTRRAQCVSVPGPEIPVVDVAVEKPFELRPMPSSFRGNTYRPNIREGEASGSIDMGSFSPGKMLAYVDDPRVWWESDNDVGDTECDHSMHAAMEAPLRRLMDLVHERDGTLEVHDAYRPAGIHNAKSLHREGRAIDLTCDELGLEELAKLCWMAGFDWVFHESKARGGAHVHCSMKRGE